MSYIIRNKLKENESYKINKQIFNFVGKLENKYYFENNSTLIALRENKLLLVKADF